MRNIDEFSKVIGEMNSFNEMISCGCKRVALGHPVDSIELRDEYMIYAKEMCKERGTMCCEENGGFITDLFPVSMNKNKYNILFYAAKKDRDDYFNLKKKKEDMVASKTYHGDNRLQMAYDFGKLLSYSDEAIKRMIENNMELEEE